MPKYPEITVPLSNRDGNGRCQTALRLAKKLDEWPEFYTQATSGDYTTLLITVMKWFTVE